MTKLLFLGSGSAFGTTTDNYQSNVIITLDNGEKLLIDCGSDIRFSLHAVGLSCQDITDIYISHLHADHIGGLEYMAFGTKFNPQCNRPILYISTAIAAELWDNSLSAGLRSVQGRLMSMDDYFEMKVIEQDKNYFHWKNIKFELVKVTHIDNGSYVMPSYGLFFEINSTKIFYTSDTQLCLSELQPHYDRANLIFQDCELSPFPSSVHAHFEDLKKLPSAIKNKMWLYGYQPVPLPDAQANGFLGFVKRAQSFDL